jgi:uncharacterized protein YegP (UPF0339 family)
MKNPIPILKGKKGYYFHVKARNGKILCHSETYKSKQSAIKGAQAMAEVVIQLYEAPHHLSRTAQ